MICDQPRPCQRDDGSTSDGRSDSITAGEGQPAGNRGHAGLAGAGGSTGRGRAGGPAAGDARIRLGAALLSPPLLLLALIRSGAIETPISGPIDRRVLAWDLVSRYNRGFGICCPRPPGDWYCNPSDRLPLVEEILPAPEPADVFSRIRRGSRIACSSTPRCVIRRSAAIRSWRPIRSISCNFRPMAAKRAGRVGRADRSFPAATAPNVPPFQGGAAGLLSYDLGRSLELLPRSATDAFSIPALALGVYDFVVAFDHVAGRAWIISQGFPERDPSRRHRRAAERLAQVRQWLAGPYWDGSTTAIPTEISAHVWGGSCTATPNPVAKFLALPIDRLAHQYPLDDVPGVTSNFSKEDYLGPSGG